MEAAFGRTAPNIPRVEKGAPLPHRVVALGDGAQVLVTNDAGEFMALDRADFATFAAGRLTPDSPAYDDLVARHLLLAGRPEVALRLLATKVRTKKAFVQQGPALHILVPTLRCHQSCLYCQVSRRPIGADSFDMSPETALHAVERILESDAAALTVEFQGGEPLLGFDIIKLVVETIRRRAPDRRVTFSITSTLHHLTDDIAAFLAEHSFQVSASIDGPEDIHNANRPLPGADAHRRTMEGVALARRVIGAANVAAITTVTRRGLHHPEGIVDALIGAGFPSVFLRPLSPYGFALRSARRTGYDMDAFQAFYRRALDRILWWNRQGVEAEEAYAAILLTHILTPFHSGYVDLRSPAGAGLGVLAYDYDGGVYASDEGRMLAAAGDPAFRMGTVRDPLPVLMASDAMRLIATGGVAEDLPGCRDCAFLPYCGSDPVHHYATQGHVRADRQPSDFCRRHTGLFHLLFGLLLDGPLEKQALLTRWGTQRLRPEAAA
ncbi:His-Xaa-Ser system radical SAM maturase HxsB [Roseomonas sp. HJA6]|uniref:His-Xaa-Ser system radical SAM maturase HxsB n=1 Tax=Roseomonas alba TaxID=2846776 RepID=A0ABS7A3Z7_9PROT|nr:His-Xaa-Ser system radical SAM maturase HxsB [Neoroseomonas alba]MBW6397018.1 His-Xaa-Ser system radical SAM maturase HxsB [Neoroseomonas alba]